MYFHTLPFFLFFVVTLLGWRLLPRPAWVLLAASILFYVVAGWFDLALIVGVIALNWVLIVAVANPRARIVLAIMLNIGVLAAFKYRAFLFGEVITEGVTYTDITLPLGISFYVFQILAYQIDVAKGRTSEARSPLDFTLFIMFFPQLIAGPIVRASQLLPQIKRLIAGNRRRVRLIGFGLGLCLLGLVKKIVFADSLAPLVDELFLAPPDDAYSAWLGAWLFAFQIYFDFSGYSDIAIGAAYLLGIRLPVNFLTPYLSTSPREFWRRWHITLSTWIRDYLYIPLGGRQGGALRQAVVVVLVMAVGGFWHGADWTFMIWGALWGVYIALGRTAALDWAPGPLRWAPHMAVVVMLWVLFRAPDLTFAVVYLESMYGLGADGFLPRGGLGATEAWTILGCVGLMALHFGEARLHNKRTIIWLRRRDGPLLWGLLAGASFWLMAMPKYSDNPFIYFRF